MVYDFNFRPTFRGRGGNNKVVTNDWITEEKGLSEGLASLNASAKLAAAQRPEALTPRLLRAGFYYCGLDSHTTTTNALVAGTLHFTPCYNVREVAIDRICTEVTAVGAGSVLRLGVYTNNPATDEPQTLLFDAGTIESATATGAKEITVAQTLPEGLVWLACVAQGGAPTVRAVASFHGIVPQSGVLTPSNVNVSGWTQTGVTAALPTTAAPAAGVARTPKVMYRVGS